MKIEFFDTNTKETLTGYYVIIEGEVWRLSFWNKVPEIGKTLCYKDFLIATENVDWRIVHG